MEKTINAGVEVYSFQNCPYDWNPDILHVNEYMPSIFALALFPNCPVVTSVHSQLDVEKPFINNRVYKYICIRPQIQEMLLENNIVHKDDTTLIYNGIDFDRFGKRKAKKNISRNVLFVGTIDPLRKKAIEDLIADAKEKDYRVTIVGKKHDIYLDNPPSHVSVLEPTWNVQKYLEDATETAGILLGRTTIEGWVAGLPGWIYDIDLEGNILKKTLFPPPKDIQKFNINNVADSIINLYEQAINRKPVAYDDKSLALASSSVIAETINNKNAINELIGRSSDMKQLINYLGSENYNVNLRLQQLESKIDQLSEKYSVLSLKQNRITSALGLIVKSIRKIRKTSKLFKNKKNG
jgi:glycosyltransferase involved in cell wall biosynthesis/regulator of replication initiation timing